MDETQELQESQIVEEGTENGDASAGTDEAVSADAQPSAGPFRKSRAKRPTVKAVENKTTEIEQRVAGLAEQGTQLSRRLETVEASLEQAQAGAAANHDGAELELAERVRQLDERLQKLANILTQQNWGTDRV